MSVTFVGEGGVVDGLTEKIKSIPPIVWVGAGGVLLFAFFMSRGSGGAVDKMSGDDVTGIGGDGGEFTPDIDQEISNLFAEIRQDAKDRAAWQAGMDAYIKGHATPSAQPVTPPTATEKTKITPLTPAPAGRTRQPTGGRG